jgi:hypothetical protein
LDERFRRGLFVIERDVSLRKAPERPAGIPRES